QPLRVTTAQVARLEGEIAALNADLPALTSFVLPGGTALVAHLHVARTTARRAERSVAALKAAEGDAVSAEVGHYLNRLSDLLFVA
ncbi:ATP:cob(I)alamin adenosyltransferase, partial [Mycobacterium tuberculosis]|nr:ATP:cob(I)alamin adenosyltransferase [Mycobacterium tuberculosis]